MAPRAGSSGVPALEELLSAAMRVTADPSACARWTAAERARALAVLDRLAGRLATVRAAVLAAELAVAPEGGPGDRDVVAARARIARVGMGEARREVRQAETLTAMPVVSGAVAAGRVPLPHLDALARAAARAGERGAAALATPAEQDRVVRLAERLSVREFAGAVSRLVASFDPESLERDHDAQRAARFLVLSHQPDGVHVRGRLDALSGAVLRSALDSVGVVPDAERDKQQADADALVAVARRALTGMAGVRGRRPGAGELAGDEAADRTSEQTTEYATERAADARVSGSAGVPLVSLLVPVETFVALRAARSASSRPGADTEAGVLAHGVEPATLEDGRPVAASEVARLLCDAEVGRVVVDADSVPLDLGRTSRLFSASQRRAVVIRDRACAWNGCEVPAAYGELHHMRWWDRDGGTSDLVNAVLLCSHHHHVVHRLDLAIARVGPPPGTRGSGPAARRETPVRYEFRWASGRDRGELVNGPPVPAGLPVGGTEAA